MSTETETPPVAVPAPAVDLSPLLAKLDELKSAVARPAVETPKSVPAPKPRVTQAQLAQLVEQQKITYADALELWGKQILEDADDAIESKLNAKLQSVKTETRQETEAAQLLSAHPELGVEGSDLRRAAVAEYNSLVADGWEPGPRTQLKAAKLAVKALAAEPTPVVETTKERAIVPESTTPSATRRQPGPRKQSNKERIESIADPAVRRFLDMRMAGQRYKGYDDPKLTKYLDAVFARAQKNGRAA